MNTEEKHIDKVRKMIMILLPIPLFLGTVGYYLTGMDLADSIYYGIRLYGLEWEAVSKNIYVEIARWTAPLLTVASLATAIKSTYAFLRNKLVAMFCKDSTAIYSCSDKGEILKKNIPNSILVGKKPVKHVKNHILMFDTDQENLLFYRTHKAFFEKKKQKSTVYLCLNEVDSYLLKEDLDNVRIINTNDIIARALWKEIKVWNTSDKQNHKKIAILGFDYLGQKILDYALQMNLYARKQCVEYHILGDSELYEASHRFFQPMNKDRIVFHKAACEEKWEVLREADYIIVSHGADIELLQSLLLGCEGSQIYYYSPADEKLTDYLQTNRLTAFGEDRLIYNNEHIRTDMLYQAAKKMHYDYLLSMGTKVSEDMEEEWRKISGFDKGSNISSCDYQEIMQEMVMYNADHNITMEFEEYAELEHIRWCRYYFLNGWKYGVPKDGKNRSLEQKIHKGLRPYSELPGIEKEKDRNIIQKIITRKQ